MDRNFRTATLEGTAASRPSEAWLFAQALLGKSVPSPSREKTEARVNREHLEWLAKISPQHENRLRDSLREETDATAEREQLEGLAKISPRHESHLRRLLTSEAEAREAQGRFERLVEGWNVQEAQWDPSKHPRRGGPPNAGWFATTGGVGGGVGRAASTVPVTGASYSGPKRVAAQQVSIRSGVGHHWAPVGAVLDKEIRSLLSDGAVEYSMGAYSGPTDPSHKNANYGGLTHPQYNDIVKKELKKFIKQHKIKKMTAEQMKEFISLVNNGLDASGKPHPQLAAFNKAIKKALPKGTSAPSKMEDILAAGRKYLKSSRFHLLAAGAVVSGVLSEVVAQQVNVLDVASNSGHYKRAMQALQDGDLDRAQRLLVGDRDSLYMEILVRVGAHAALNFKTAMEKVFAAARDREYK